MAADAARSANAWFLAVVAAWRVALLAVFLKRIGGLSAGAVVVATLLPLSIIAVALTIMNVEHVVFDIMSGTREEDRSPNDTAYVVVFVISYFSFMVAPFLLLVYLFMAYGAWRRARADLPADGPGPAN
jgi:hypothetical protein